MSPGPTVRSAFRVLLLVIGSVAASAASPAFAAQPDGHVVKVTVTSSRVSLTARETPLADVLAAIGRQAGVKIVLRGDLDGPVTETLVNVPLDDAIQRLSRWHSVVLIYDGSTHSVGGPILTEAWVTGYPDPASARQGSTEPRVQHRSDDKAPAGASPSTESEQWARTLIAFKDANPETRSQQIEALVRAHGEHAIVAGLREVATRDPAPRARRAAIQVLAVMGSPDALAAVRATLADAHPGVRSEANTALRRQSRARTSEGSVD